MRTAREHGYILASALAALLSLSIVAATLVSVSIDLLHRVRARETAAGVDLALRSAIVLAAHQLTIDPQRRSMAIRSSTFDVPMADIIVTVRVRQLDNLLDLNAASTAEIDEALERYLPESAKRAALLSRIEEARATGALKLDDDLGMEPPPMRCLTRVASVFGRRLEGSAIDQQAQYGIGRLSAGSHVELEASLASQADRSGRRAVLLLTGNDNEPFWLLDEERVLIPAEETCRE